MDRVRSGGDEMVSAAVGSGLEAAPTRQGSGSGSPPTRRNEVELLRSAASGDPDTVRILLDHYLTAIHGFVFVSVGDAAVEDILQETLIEAIRSAGSFRGESSLTTWLHAIARRRIFRHYSKERRQRGFAAELSIESSESEAIVGRNDWMARALHSLTPVHRQVLVMKYLNDLSVQQIANTIGKSQIQVQSLLQRARFALREALENDEI